MKAFLGGTCNGSDWRDRLIPNLTIGYFNPVAPDWTPECQQREIQARETCDFCVYVITPLMAGVYSIAEVIDDSNKRPTKTVFCFLETDYDRTAHQHVEFDAKMVKSLKATGEMVVRNGGVWVDNLRELADFLNKP